MAADGGGLQQIHISETFAKLAEALYIADRKAREPVEMRAQLEKKVAPKKQEKYRNICEHWPLALERREKFSELHLTRGI